MAQADRSRRAESGYGGDLKGLRLNCPVCRGDSIVLTKDEDARRRKCVRCGHRYTTVEVLKDEQKRLQGIVEKVKEAVG